MRFQTIDLTSLLKPYEDIADGLQEQFPHSASKLRDQNLEIIKFIIEIRRRVLLAELENLDKELAIYSPDHFCRRIIKKHRRSLEEGKE